MLSNGQQIGNYKILSAIGAGGMGEVFLAEDTRLDRRVALKILPAGVVQGPERMRRFIQEAKVTSALNHPNIITIHEIGEAEETHFIVTEYIEGETLRQRLNQNVFSLFEALDTGIQIASALQAAHSINIVHRDIKPENIMIRRDSLVKILDFGIAKLTEKKTELFNIERATTIKAQTNPGMIIGTVAYMSPEQAQRKEVDGRSDIFSFGVVMYEMLTGKQPFAGENAIEIIVKILNREPVALKHLLPEIPSELEQIINKALSKDIENRYRSAEELLDDLKKLKKRLELEAELGQSSQPDKKPEEKTQILNAGTNIPPNNLSENFLPIVGRENEILEIKNLLMQKDIRLLTLTGIGGTGKTTLAKSAAGELLSEFADGVFFVELASINNPELVASTITKAFGVKETSGKPVLELLKDYLSQKRLLLVIDNFEQVIRAAPQIGELLSAAAKLKILITSRTFLHLSAEHEYAVPPLAVPEDLQRVSFEELSSCEAVQLFTQRARKAKPNFCLTEENIYSVAEICARLEGLPLAIELAAARVKILAPPAILSKLESSLQLLTGGARDLPSRQQTMRDAIEWSYELLSEDEKRLFCRLSVFAGGFRFEAAEAVCANNEPAEERNELLDKVTSLVEKSLLAAKEQPDGEMRFRMLSVVREYARESLEKSAETGTIRRNHAEYFLALAEEAEPHLQVSQSAAWLNRLEEEHDNIRAAIRWSLQHDAEIAARLAASIKVFWTVRGHLTEGEERLKKILKKSADYPLSVRFKLLNGLGVIMRQRGDFNAAKKAYEESLKEAKAVTDLRQIALSSRGLGLMAYHQGDLATALKFYQEGLEISRELNDKSGISYSLNFIGELLRAKGDLSAARPILEEALALCRELGKKESISGNLLNLGFIAFAEGDFEAAQSHFAEGLRTARELGNKKNISYALDGFAAISVKAGELEQSARLAGAAEHLRESVGLEIEPNERRCRDSYLAELKTKMNIVDFTKAYEQGRKLKPEEAIMFCFAENRT
ncbi:MAG TPA: protein kinase [Pyrinomonadaceae bacterium]|nr:protein kinase [Pyrinomonadaceae bacterium]